MEFKKAETILIVDDTTTNLAVISRTLRNAGFKILVAKDGEKALQVVELETPDLILMDVIMPGIDGFETCRRIKENSGTKDIPVIFMTALADTVDKVKGLSMGAVDYITKPFQEEEVLARVKQHLRMHYLTRKLEEQNALLQKEIKDRKTAQEASSAKSQFLAKMSHELRTPLNAILGFAQLMERDDRLSQEQREYLGIISRSGEHLLNLINDVLEMSKIEAGRVTLKETSFDLSAMLKSIEEMFALKAQSKGLLLEIQSFPEVPQCIKTDEGKLRQVLINILGNAIKFTETGSVKLCVEVQNRGDDPTEEQLHFMIQDSGPGITPEEIHTIFEPFVQAELGRKSNQGTGLGLPISREFVHLMGGEILVSSAVEKGTIFTFHLPLRRGQAISPPPAPVSRRAIGLAPGQPTYRILVVEDKWENRQLLVKMLQPLGFQVLEATNGKEGVDIWHERQPDLIWMDIQMPVMDGYEATKQIKATREGKFTPIIALSASAFEEERAAIFAAGCDDFASKPLQEGEILTKMAAHLGVRYIYEEPTFMGTSPSSPDHPEVATISLKPEDLAELPSELVVQLHQAAVSVNAEQIFGLLEQIPADRAPLGAAIANLVNDFRFDIIIDLTEKNNGNS
ncbi:MAG TPA: response regulator [Oscillatoriaceae cyanobacterium M33_DOE_052]|uniref:Circadian input-output histidine kinase CikA n=1 Tax=Planktothricoides sp. SpSt-374 TaxID=2282167 RepID=A0A7C3ZNB2_9CYAN|nr:response regulator [Oscillatoriaceae cyanobacterium M33_DOE_052]